MILTALFAILTSLMIINFVQNLVKHWKSNLPLIGIPLPLIGHFHLLFGLPDTFYKKLESILARKISFSVLLGPVYLAIIGDTEILTKLYKSENEFKAKAYVYDILKYSWEQNIFCTTGKTYTNSKRVLLAAVSPSNLKEYMKTFNECSRSLVEDIRSKIGSSEVNLKSDIVYCVFNNLLGTVMGTHRDDLIISREEIADFANHVNCFLKTIGFRMYSFWLHPEFIFKLTKYYKRQTNSMNEIRETLRRIITARKEKFESGLTYNETTTIIIDKYFEMAKEDGSNFTVEEIIDDVLSLFMAGIETTEVALGSAINLLAIHKNVQENVQKECDEVNVEEIDMENVEKLIYLDQVISEVMRLYPPVPLVGRKLDGNIELANGGLLEKGTDFLVPILGIHRNSNLYADALTFNPDNFLPEKVNSRPALSYLPFGVGSRKCFGAKFSNLFIKTFLYHFFKNYKVQTNKTERDFRFSFGITAKNKIGVPVFITSRKS